MVLDDQRIHLPGWVDTIMADADAAQYVDGVGVHWYTATEDILPSSLYWGNSVFVDRCGACRIFQKCVSINHPNSYMSQNFRSLAHGLPLSLFLPRVLAFRAHLITG